jgi:hypothetical protein
MPLTDGARNLIRANLEALQEGKRAPIVEVGRLTKAQLNAINTERCTHGHPPVGPEIHFVGRHIYESRILRDGYTIEDVIIQIESGMDAASIVVSPSRMAAMENPNPRADGYGNHVRDRIVFECSARHPRAELFGVIPKGDFVKPIKRPPIEMSGLQT